MSGYPGVKMAQLGASAPIIINLNANAYWQAPPSYSLGIICTVAPGSSLTYSVQLTADAQPSATGNWNNHDALVALTTSANGNIAFPVSAMRLNVTAYTSGSVNLGVAQWP